MGGRSQEYIPTVNSYGYFQLLEKQRVSHAVERTARHSRVTRVHNSTKYITQCQVLRTEENLDRIKTPASLFN